jgi:hypothetical protein
VLLVADDQPSDWTQMCARHADEILLLAGAAAFRGGGDSAAQQQARVLTDLYFNPPLYRIGMLVWSKCALVGQQGYQHALETLGDASTEVQSAPILKSAATTSGTAHEYF